MSKVWLHVQRNSKYSTFEKNKPDILWCGWILRTVYKCNKPVTKEQTLYDPDYTACLYQSNSWKNKGAGSVEEWRKENRESSMSIISVLHKQRSPRNLVHNNMSILNNNDLHIRSRRIKVCRRSVRKRRGRPKSCICACNPGFQGWRRSTWGLQSSCFKPPSEWGLFTLENQRVF